ncbi:alpha/beta hydrolase [Saccharopolyspora sp. NPDC047091]|uniref:alpha/beta hydrolase n=1 Tax=Saccharopolyspora sp. NPDC047091 TaxID=3155924 RepID=UPI0033DCF9F1
MDEAPAPLGARYPVPAGEMLLHRSGSGGPPAVFLAGGGMSGLHGLRLHEQVAECTTSVLVDRLGLGWSDPVELPRSGTRVTDDLRALLRAADVPGPRVLVGHSLGGLYARLYAKRFPDEVAGLVLLDPTHEEIVQRLPTEAAQRLRAWTTDVELPADRLTAMRDAYRAAVGRALADWPTEVREPLLARGFGPAAHLRSLRESMNLPELFREVREAGPDPDLPLVLVSAMGSDAFADELSPPEARASAAEAARAKHELYADFTAALPRAELRRLDDVGHSGLVWSRPDAAARAVRDVLAR